MPIDKTKLLTVGTLRQQCALQSADELVIIKQQRVDGTVKFFRALRAYPDTPAAPQGSGLYMEIEEYDVEFQQLISQMSAPNFPGPSPLLCSHLLPGKHAQTEGKWIHTRRGETRGTVICTYCREGLTTAPLQGNIVSETGDTVVEIANWLFGLPVVLKGSKPKVQCDGCQATSEQDFDASPGKIHKSCNTDTGVWRIKNDSA